MLKRCGAVIRVGVMLLIFSLISLPLQAAQLTIPDSFEFLALDGKAISSSLLSHQSDLTLTEGEHMITLRYMDVIIDPDLGYESVINSKPFVIELQVDSGGHYRLEPEPVAFQDKQAFAKDPQVMISSKSEPQSRKAAIIQSAASAEMLVVEPVIQQVETKQVSEVAVTEYQGAEERVTVGEQLQYWWLKADKQTRDAFMSWVIAQ
ncbi:MAG: DUF2057 domain-containing protein [Candidatus Thiodiazotropha sp. LLP2]